MTDWSGSIASFSPLVVSPDDAATAGQVASSNLLASGRRCPGLLVSVRSVAEAMLVAPLGIDVLDLKEPSKGPLASTTPEVWAEVLAQTGGLVPLSAALGEFDDAIKIAAKVPRQFKFAKVGPSKCKSVEKLRSQWQAIRDRLSDEVELVAVAYADDQAASCPSPELIFELAASIGLKTWLIDTFSKDGRSSLVHLTPHDLQRISSMAKSNQSQWVLAGSIRIEMIANEPSWNEMPDLFGVRGDVCNDSRTGEISIPKVQRWLAHLRAIEMASRSI